MILLTLALTLAPAGDGSVWDRLAECESGGNWTYDGAFDGGLQFLPSTWTAMGGPTRYAWQATREQQIAVAVRLQAELGWGAWPGCARQLGLYGTAPSPSIDYVALETQELAEQPPQSRIETGTLPVTK